MHAQQGYVLGVDLGTTFTAAAVARPGEPAVGVPLGSRGAATPTIAYLGTDGEFLVGEGAARRALTDPDRVVREFKRRIGDETPLLLGAGGDRINAHRLAALVIAWVVRTVSARQGERPETVVITHPAAWGAHKQQLLRTALVEVGVPEPMLITEPYAAAVAYAESRALEPSSTLAVYDLGGGTFDASVLRVEASGQFTPLGRPIGLPDLGGIDFDDAILAHVVETLGDQVASLDPADPVVASALTRLRRECVDAKEALSADTVVTIPVVLGGVATNLRLTRTEFEVMIEPAVARTLETLDVALTEAELTPGTLGQLLLTGGSARIPFIRQALSAHLGASVVIGRDLDPKLAVALGAAMTGARRAAKAPLVPTTPPDGRDTEVTAERPALAAIPAPARPPADLPVLVQPRGGGILAARLLRTAGALTVIGGVAAAAAFGVIPGVNVIGGRDSAQPAGLSGKHLVEERAPADRGGGASADSAGTDARPAAAPAATGNQPPTAPRVKQTRPVSPTRIVPRVNVVRRDVPARSGSPAAEPVLRPMRTGGSGTTVERRPTGPAATRPAMTPEQAEAPLTPRQPTSAAPSAEQNAPATTPDAPPAENTSSGGTSLESGPTTPVTAPQAPPRARGFAPTAPPAAPGG